MKASDFFSSCKLGLSCSCLPYTTATDVELFQPGRPNPAYSLDAGDLDVFEEEESHIFEVDFIDVNPHAREVLNLQRFAKPLIYFGADCFQLFFRPVPAVSIGNALPRLTIYWWSISRVGSERFPSPSPLKVMSLSLSCPRMYLL